MKIDTALDQEILQMQLTEFAEHARRAASCNVAIVICAHTDGKETAVAMAYADNAPKGMELDKRYLGEVVEKAAEAFKGADQ